MSYVPCQSLLPLIPGLRGYYTEVLRRWDEYEQVENHPQDYKSSVSGDVSGVDVVKGDLIAR